MHRLRADLPVTTDGDRKPHAGRDHVPTLPTSPAPPARRYRPELQGLRAVAALLVVVYHVWLGRISGGVDVFFVLSGFLITGQLVRSCARGGIRFRPMWGRMIRRLFPAALTVLLAVMAVSFVLLPESRWFQTIREVVASALYLENWQLVADSTDYFAQHNTASVVQHFWSLSIQGQFYVVWPVLVAGLALLAVRLRRGLRPVLVGVFGVVFAGSLAVSVWLTAVDQPMAYFHSATRVWEFALGGLLALVIDAVRLPRVARWVLGWLGVVGLVSCGLVLQVGTVFPGWAALWPTLSAVAVVTAGATGSRSGADRLLSTRPLEYLGNLSYALYLWHWPVLLFYLVTLDQPEPGVAGGLLVIAVSLGLAVLTYHFVETPVREGRLGPVLRMGAYRLGVLMLAPVLVMAGAWQVAASQKADYTISLDDPDHPGAISRLPDFTYAGAPDAPLAPRFISLPNEFAEIEPEQCHLSPRSVELRVCATETEGPPPERTIVVAGDSHAQQFIGALRPIAERRNWRIVSMLRGGCPFSTRSETVPGDQPCVDWNAHVVEEIVELRPDAVFTTATRDVRVGLTEETPPGFVEQWRALADAGIPVLAARDNPRYDFWPSICVEAKGRHADACATPRAALLAPEPPYRHVPDLPPNVRFLDFSDFLCTEDVCPPVIGNVLVYLDDNHVTETYMRTMAPIVEGEILAVMDW